MVMQWYLWRVRTVVCSICVRVGVLVPLTPVMPVERRGIRKRQSWQIRWLCLSQNCTDSSSRLSPVRQDVRLEGLQC